MFIKYKTYVCFKCNNVHWLPASLPSASASASANLAANSQPDGAKEMKEKLLLSLVTH